MKRVVSGAHRAFSFLLFAALVTAPAPARAQNTDDLVFIHHSCGQNWLDSGLRTALDAKAYVDEVNDIYYGTVVSADSGRPASLGGVPGDHTDMCHWILWFNDYLSHVKTHGCATGANKIIMFKSCYPLSNIYGDGSEPGDPFSATQSLANYRAVFRHPSGPGNTYSNGGYTYRALEDVFAANTDTLFVFVTAPSNVPEQTCNAWADRGRAFGDWAKNTWLPAYNAAHPAARNVAVFDWFDVLTYPAADTRTEVYQPADGSPSGTYPVRNMTRSEYRSSSSDSHPNGTANAATTQVFATNPTNFIDTAHSTFLPAGVSAWEVY